MDNMNEWPTDFIAATTPEQRASLARLAARYGESIPDAVARASRPTGPLTPYVGIVYGRTFHGIEPDGHTHT